MMWTVAYIIYFCMTVFEMLQYFLHGFSILRKNSYEDDVDVEKMLRANFFVATIGRCKIIILSG